MERECSTATTRPGYGPGIPYFGESALLTDCDKVAAAPAKAVSRNALRWVVIPCLAPGLIVTSGREPLARSVTPTYWADRGGMMPVQGFARAAGPWLAGLNTFVDKSSLRGRPLSIWICPLQRAGV